MADLDQKRAKDALGKIRKHKSAGKDSYGNYVGYVKALPAVILQCGLGQSLAMELASSEKDKGHDCLFKDLSQWLGRENDKTAPYPGKYFSQTGIIDALVDGTQSEYVKAQHESLLYVAWLKKFAVALLEQPKKEESS